MAFDSLYTGITGLNSYQSWIDMISNNIANVDTVGFKGQSMTFADLFYQNQGFATGPTSTNGGTNPEQIGVGVGIDSINTEFEQGGLNTTGVNTDLAINGDGFFIENNIDGTGTPTYTRDGAFSLNANGVLIDPGNGNAVQGWTANSNGVVTGGPIGNITIPVGLQEQATATGSGVKVGPNSQDQVFDVAMGGNLDQTQWQDSFLQTIGAQSSGGTPFTVSATLYDSLGNAHEATIEYIPVTTGSQAAGYTSVSTAGAVASLLTLSPATNQNDVIQVTGNPATGDYTITDQLGALQTVAAGQSVTVDGLAMTLNTPPTASTQTFTVTAATNGLPATVYNAAGVGVKPATCWEVQVSFDDGTTFQTITNPGTINANGTVNAASIGSGSSGTIGYAYFGQNGQFINTSSIDGLAASVAPGTSYQIGTNAANDIHSYGTDPSVLQGNDLAITLWGASAGNQAAAPASIGLDFAGAETQGGLASLSGTSTATVLSQNGYASGTLENFSVGDDGTITGDFTNGEQKTLGQVALATFTNEGGLERVGGNQFEATASSGLAQIGTAGTGKLGSIEGGALEQSNVSLSTEFTNLIIAQRAFEANTRGITTADQNLQTIINLRASEN